jgi:copper(I)-binding protein
MRARRGRTPAAIVATMIAAGCGAGDDGAGASVVEDGGMAIIDAWTRPTPPGIDTAAIYLAVENRDAPDDRINGMRADRCSTVVPHRTEIDDDGVASMPGIIDDELSLPTGASVTMEPNGIHLMCLGLGAPLELGEQFELELAFRTHPPMTVEVTVTE